MALQTEPLLGASLTLILLFTVYSASPTLAGETSTERISLVVEDVAVLVVLEQCKQFEACEQCLMGDLAQNITGCRWMHCGEESGTCVAGSETETVREECFVDSDTEMCKETHTHTKESEDTPEEPTPASPLTGSPEFTPPVFNTASFVGGIILVLCLQAIFFFAHRFIKSKESTYQTLEEQPQ